MLVHRMKAAALVALTACVGESSTPRVVWLDADPSVQRETQSIEVVVRSDVDSQVRDYVLAGADRFEWPLRFALAGRGRHDESELRLEVRAFSGPAATGALTSSALVRLELAGPRDAALAVLDGRCARVECDAHAYQGCVRGECVPIASPTASPSADAGQQR